MIFELFFLSLRMRKKISFKHLKCWIFFCLCPVPGNLTVFCFDELWEEIEEIFLKKTICVEA